MYEVEREGRRYKFRNSRGAKSLANTGGDQPALDELIMYAGSVVRAPARAVIIKRKQPTNRLWSERRREERVIVIERAPRRPSSKRHEHARARRPFFRSIITVYSKRELVHFSPRNFARNIRFPNFRFRHLPENQSSRTANGSHATDSPLLPSIVLINYGRGDNRNGRPTTCLRFSSVRPPAWYAEHTQ